MSARVAAAVSAVLCVATLVPVWWWALFGMSEQVGTAWTVTIVFCWLVVAAALVGEAESKGGDQ